jgi:hypothetical protein
MSRAAQFGDGFLFGQAARPRASHSPREPAAPASVCRNGGPTVPVTMVAQSACAEGALFAMKVDVDGQPLGFATAYPGARGWLRRLAE